MPRFLLLSLSLLLGACAHTPPAQDSTLPSYQAAHQTPQPQAAKKDNQNQQPSLLNASDYAPPVPQRPVRMAPSIGVGYGFGDFYGPSVGASFYPWWW